MRSVHRSVGLALGVWLWLTGCAAPLTPTPLPTATRLASVTPLPAATVTRTVPIPTPTAITSSPKPAALPPPVTASPRPLTPTPTRPPSPTPSPTPTRTVTAWAPLSLFARSECEEIKFNSVALSGAMPLMLYLPLGYAEQTQRRYPTLYLLSGLGGNYKEWASYDLCAKMDQLVRAGKAQPMIIVMPSGNENQYGGIGSYWFNHAPPPQGDGKRWGDYIWQDLVSFIDAKYRTLPRRESRAIGGLSAGGQGALMLGFTQPDTFSVVGAHSPSMRHADGSIAFFGDPAFFNQYDPVWLAQNSDAWKRLAIWIDDGDADKQWGGPIREFHELLTARNIPHEYTVFPGTHDPSYWSPLVPTYLQWYSSKLASP